MGTHLIKKVDVNSIKEFISSSKSTYFSNSYFVLQPKFGSAIFDFSKFKPSSCVIRFKRESGNGIMMVTSGGNSKGFQVSSKTSQSLSFNFGEDSILQIHRTARSRGDISILDISLYAEASTGVDWNKVINKCEKHYCLRMIGDELHAADGAYIVGKDIKISTHPRNMFTRDGDTVKFLGSCRILELEVSGEPRDEEPLIRSIDVPDEPPRPEEPTRLVKDTKPSVQGPLDNVIYDTRTAGFSKAYCTKEATASPGGVVLDHRGAYNIPLRMLKPNKKYLISVQVSRISGNGKFMFGILPDFSTSTVKVARGAIRTYTAEITPTQGGGDFSLSVWRHPSAKGKIQVGRILVMSEAEVAPLQAREIHHINIPAEPTPTKKSNASILDFEPAAAPSDNSALQISGAYDGVAKNAMSFSKINPHNYVVKKPHQIQSTIKTNTFNGTLWFNRVKPFLPNVTEQENPYTSISSIDNLIIADKMYIEEFTGDVPKEAIQKLNKAKVIYTSSNINAEAIASKGGYDNVRVVSRSWPYTDPSMMLPLKGDYILFSNEDPDVTKVVLEGMQSLSQNVVLLNARGIYPDFVTPVNEYIPYNNLLHIFSNAKCYLDIPAVEDYKSGVVDLALDLGVQVVSSSWAYMELPQVLFVNGSNKVNNRFVPEMSDVVEAIKDARPSPPNIEDIDKNFGEFINLFFGQV